MKYSLGISNFFEEISSLAHSIVFLYFFALFTLVRFSSVVQSCLTLCDSMNCSMPGFRIHHQLLDFTQTHDHWVGDAIQPSHPLSSPSPPALNLSQHQGLFQWASSSHQVAKVLEFQLHTSVLPMNTQDCSPLGWTGWISLQSKGLSRVFSNTIVQKHQFFSDCSLRKTFLSLLAILWNSAFKWVYLPLEKPLCRSGSSS